MRIFANLVSYGLALAAATCLATAFAKRATRTVTTRKNRS
jgi:hypothetical protein